MLTLINEWEVRGGGKLLNTREIIYIKRINNTWYFFFQSVGSFQKYSNGGNMPSVHHSTIRFFRCYQLSPEVFVESSSVRVTEVGSHTRPTDVPPKMVGTGRAGCLRAGWMWSSDHPTSLTSFPLRSFPAPHFVWGDRNVPTSVYLPWFAPPNLCLRTTTTG